MVEVYEFLAHCDGFLRLLSSPEHAPNAEGYRELRRRA